MCWRIQKVHHLSSFQKYQLVQCFEQHVISRCTSKLLLFNVSYCTVSSYYSTSSYIPTFFFLLLFSFSEALRFFALLVEEVEQSLSLIDSASWDTGLSHSRSPSDSIITSSSVSDKILSSWQSPLSLRKRLHSKKANSNQNQINIVVLFQLNLLNLLPKKWSSFLTPSFVYGWYWNSYNFPITVNTSLQLPKMKEKSF